MPLLIVPTINRPLRLTEHFTNGGAFGTFTHTVSACVCAYPPTETPHHSHTTENKAHTARTTRREEENNDRINVKGRRNVFIGIGREID
jgi:hypothetical protein